MDKDLDYLQQLTNIEEKIKVKRNELHQLIKSDNSTDKTLSISIELDHLINEFITFKIKYNK
mgnify:CR=1 FL=1|jgi:hypothetical protein